MRLIVVTNSSHATDQYRDKITKYLEQKGYSVWHWFPDLWLLDEVPDGTDIVQIRRDIQILEGLNRHVFVMTTEGKKDHSGFVPTESVQWLDEHWQRR